MQLFLVFIACWLLFSSSLPPCICDEAPATATTGVTEVTWAFCFLCQSKSAHVEQNIWSENTCLLKHKLLVLPGAFVRISDHGEVGRESTWTINFSRDAGEMLNDSDEIKCRNSLLVLPRSRCSAKTKARILLNTFLLSALGLPEAEVVSGSLCLKTPNGWMNSFSTCPNFSWNLLQGIFCVCFLFMRL